MCLSFKILNLFGILSPWGSSSYRPSAPFLYEAIIFIIILPSFCPWRSCAGRRSPCTAVSPSGCRARPCTCRAGGGCADGRSSSSWRLPSGTTRPPSRQTGYLRTRRARTVNQSLRASHTNTWWFSEQRNWNDHNNPSRLTFNSAFKKSL